MKRKLIVVLGPTASGKTRFSISVGSGQAGRSALPIEIVNADSRQFYKHMDIGTAKIQPQDMRGIPHHLLSVLDPKNQVTIGWYQKEAMRVIDNVHSRGVMPLLVGGSMLYISSIIDGLTPNPHRRSGGPPSKLKHPCPYDLYIIGMQVPRPELCRRIAERTKELLQSGWIEEVRRLLNMGYTVDDPGFMACGYREIATEIRNSKFPFGPEFMAEGEIRNKSKIQNSKLCETITMKIRQYAKRQMTWWKRDERIRWVNPSVPPQFLVEELRAFVESSPRHVSAR